MQLKSLIQITALLFLFLGCKPTKGLYTNALKDTAIFATIDLTEIVDDKVPVTVRIEKVEGKSTVYRFPGVIQGTYSTSDFGRFIESFQAFDSKGKQIPVTKLDVNSWKIDHGGELDKITYLVNDTYDIEKTSNEPIPLSPSGTNIEDDNFMLNLHGFIGYFDLQPNNQYHLSVTAPTNFKSATALETIEIITKDGVTTKKYLAPRYFDVIDNPMMYGKLDMEEFTIHDIKVVLSIYSPNNIFTAKEIKNRIMKMMKAQVNYLHNFKTTNRYDIQIYFSEGKETSPDIYGALEHHTSTVMVLPEYREEKEVYSMLTDLLSHEFFHIITPLNVHSEDIHDFDYHTPAFSKHLWMYEGVTEYFSKLFQIDQHLINESEFYAVISDKIKESKNFNDTLSFTEMSENILDQPYRSNYSNVYQKGALMAMCLDILLREESNGEKGLLSIMNELSNEYGKDKPFVDDSLIHKITSMTYPSVGHFLTNHVEGETAINYQNYFDKVGMTLKNGDLNTIDNPTIDQLSLKDAWLSQKPKTIVFENVNVIPMDREIVMENQRVVISDGRIISIEPAFGNPKPNSQTVINGAGKYLIPGLSEMHYHWRDTDRNIENDFKLLIANGVTTTRNMAEYEGQDHISIRNKVEKGEIMGPNYTTTGPYLQAYMLQTEEDVKNVVKHHKEKGYDFLKIGDGDGISKDIYLKLLEEASQNKIDVIGHGQHKLDLEYSLRMKSIEHVEEFIYIFNDTDDFRYLNYDEDFLNNAARQIQNSGLYVAPTLVIFEMITQYLDDKKFTDLQSNKESGYLSSAEYEKWLTEKNHYRADFKDKDLGGVNALTVFTNYFGWMKTFTKILHNHHVPLLTGSDTFGMVVPGFSLHKEFEFLQECGLSPYEILKASTVNSARYLNKISMEGTITEGKNANLVLLNNNPLQDISYTKTIEGVMLNGEWYDRKELDKFLKDVELLETK